MIIKGLQKLTLLDYPGLIACTVFTGGCNIRCPFCHNGSLVLCDGEESISREEFLAFLDSRSGRLEGVCVSGGEPTLHRDLPRLLFEIKSRGFSVKLDTNGTNPELLLSLINDGLVDYVAMDIKNSPEKYHLTAGIDTSSVDCADTFPSSGRLGRGEDCSSGTAIGQTEEQVGDSPLLEKIRKSAEILMQGRVDFEFRTTLVRELHSESDMISIGKWLSGNEKYFLQTYRDEGDLLVGGFSAYTRAETEQLLAILREFIPAAEIR